MAYFALLWKARIIEKYRHNYEKEKLNSIMTSNTDMPKKTMSQKWRRYRYDTGKRISELFRKWYPEGSSVSNFFVYLKTDQTFPNFVLKSILGFVGGIILTYLCFMFFVFQLSISLIHATIMSSIIGVLLTLGLAFSYRIRCLVFLLIPQFFSRVGRYTLTCYALVLILTGPATNTLKNSEVLTESMACSQEQIKVSVNQITDAMKKPFNAIKDSMKSIMERLRDIAVQMKQIVIKVNRMAISIVRVIRSSFVWLNSVSKLCNKKIGTPYERCTKALEDGVLGCKTTIGPNVSGSCDMAYIAQVSCLAVKPVNTICIVADFVNEGIPATVKKRLKNFSNRIKAMMYVEIHIHHSYSFSSNTSRSASQVAAGIVTEIRNRADPLLTWLSWSSCVTSLFLLLIIFRAKYYQHMFETRSRFDNRYVTKELRDLDLKRLRQGRETVLPLNRRERAKYVKTTSFRLVASEKVYLNRSAVFMAITTFKLLIHMIADYSLYWVLMTIRYHGRFQSPLQPGVPHPGVRILGTGLISKIFRSVIDSISIPLAKPAPSLIPCLPDPYPPDLQRYTQIGVLIFLLWFFALFEPYGLRLRHVIMGHYRPERAKARAVWLYNHILRTRGSFMKSARRKLHREFKYYSEEDLTFRRWLDERIPCWWLRYLLGTSPEDPHCVLCGTFEHKNDDDSELVRCKTPGCPGIYCSSCFSGIGQLCTICLSPDDYGDHSDVSLEKGSSEDSDSDDGDDGKPRPDNSNSESINLSNLRHVAENESLIKKKKNDPKYSDRFFSKKSSNTECQDEVPLLSDDDSDKENCLRFSNKDFKTDFILKNRNYPQNNRSNALNNKITLKVNGYNSISCNTSESINLLKAEYDYISKKDDKKQIEDETIINEFKTSLINPMLEISHRSDPSFTIETLNLKSISSNLSLRKRRLRKWNLTFDVTLRRNSRRKVKEKSHKRNCLIPKVKLFFQSSIYDIRRANNLIDVTKIHSATMSNKFQSRTNRRRKSPNGMKSFIKYFMKIYYPMLTIVCNRGRKHHKIFNIFSNYFLICSCSKNQNVSPTLERKDKKIDINNDESDKETKESIPQENKIGSKNSHRYSHRFHTLFSVYWSNVKHNFTQCSKTPKDFIRNDTELPEEKTKHKRRKKEKNRSRLQILIPKKRAVSKEKEENTRDYRISAYLAEQDWIKRRSFDEEESNKMEKDIDPILDAKVENTSETQVPKELKKHKNCGKIKVRCTCANHSKGENHNSVVEKMIDLTQKSLSRGQSGESRGLSLLRRMNFYRALGNKDFDDANIDSTTDENVPAIELSQKTEELTKTASQAPLQDFHNENPARELYNLNLKSQNKDDDLEDDDDDEEIRLTRLKCVLSRRISLFRKNANRTAVHSRLRSPLSVLKSFYSSIFGDSDKGTNTDENTQAKDPSVPTCAFTVDKEVTVQPVVQSCSCQYMCRHHKSKDHTTQIPNKHCKSDHHKCTNDAEAETVNHYCTCAIQCRVLRRDAATMHYNAVKQLLNASVQYSRRDTANIVLKEKSKHTHFEDISEEQEPTTQTSETSDRSEDETKTDTTVCSLVTIDYLDETNKQKKDKLKLKVITKENRSTVTDNARVCDVSTTTNDWWSPILERKEKDTANMPKKDKERKRDKRESRKKMTSTGVSTDGRIVTFRSRAQIIPTTFEDVLSPSRYLLESQKYYNELFSSKFYAPHVFPASQNEAQEQLGGDYLTNYQYTRRGRKTKRLDDTYSPRKQMSPRKRFDNVWRAEVGHKRQNSLRQHKQRTISSKKSRSQKHLHDQGESDTMVSDRSGPREATSDNNLSLDGQCNSTCSY